MYCCFPQSAKGSWTALWLANKEEEMNRWSGSRYKCRVGLRNYSVSYFLYHSFIAGKLEPIPGDFWLSQLTSSVCIWIVGRNQRTWRKPMHAHATILLPVAHRIKFRTLTLAYKAKYGPAYHHTPHHTTLPQTLQLCSTDPSISQGTAKTCF